MNADKRIWEERETRLELFLHWLLYHAEHTTIFNCFKDKYLTRWYLFRRERFGFFLHLFHQSDEDRALHDHPWSFISLILWRGYREHTPKGVSRKWPGMILYRPSTWRHRVELIDGKSALTLILRFRGGRVWGYWYTPETFIAHDQWWRENCE